MREVFLKLHEYVSYIFLFIFIFFISGTNVYEVPDGKVSVLLLDLSITLSTNWNTSKVNITEDILVLMLSFQVSVIEPFGLDRARPVIHLLVTWAIFFKITV